MSAMKQRLGVIICLTCAAWTSPALAKPGQSDQTIPTPPPPPAPPVASTPVAVHAIEQARDCVTYPKKSGFADRFDAERATADLTESIGSAQWQSARKVVLSFVEGRHHSYMCIKRMDDLLRNGDIPIVDRPAVKLNIESMRQFWSDGNQYQDVILLRLIDRISAKRQADMNTGSF
ncbi:hypothetical protein ACQHGV_05700 [Sphingomonas pseudosanguinis]|uniref:hypothetical protein n=1 Tax=Sphingomonas pseudosanguinis TaxID=413712 RepID=UPI003F84EFDB